VCAIVDLESSTDDQGYHPCFFVYVPSHPLFFAFVLTFLGFFGRFFHLEPVLIVLDEIFELLPPSLEV
jgi:hypothetical protein